MLVARSRLALPRLALPLLLVIAGCGEATDARPGPSPTRSPTASPVPRPSQAAVSTTSVGGVPIGTPAADAERRLVAALGTPDRVGATPSCNGATAKAFRWGDFLVTLNDADGKGVVLQGWQMGYGESPFVLQLPFGIKVGTPVSQLLRTVPGASGTVGEGPTEGGYVVTTPRAPGLVWFSHSGDASGLVDEVSFRPFACD